MSLKLVYLDDEAMLCEIFKEMISTEVISITTFSKAEEAIEYINSNNTDIVFLDYRLYNITGDEVAQKLPTDLTKVLISGDISIKTNYKFIKTFQKPVDYSEIKVFIKNFTESR